MQTAVAGRFEDELRHEDVTVTLPYWDTRPDAHMDNGVNSLIWSSGFLGNANGEVVTGPFASKCLYLCVTDVHYLENNTWVYGGGG